MVSAGSYILSAALLALLALSLGFSAVRLRRLLLPGWAGAPAHLVDAVLGVALLIWLSELLGVVQLLYAWALVLASLLLAAAIVIGPRVLSRGEGGRGEAPPSSPGRLSASTAVAAGVMAVVFAHYGLTAADALGRGIFNFDSLWYHMPFAVEMAKSHSVTGIHYTETVFTNWFYPQNSELLHAVGILVTERDTLSLFLNFGWLAMAFLAAWCIGRPYGRGPLAVVAAAVILECHTLVVREPGAAKNDLMAAALLLAAIAILVNAWAGSSRPRVLSARGGAGASLGFSPAESAAVRGRCRGEKEDAAVPRHPPSPPPAGGASLPVGWAMATAGLAAGLAAGTKVTVLAMAAALSLAVLVLAPAGRRWAAAGWWFLPALAAGGYWYLRNLIVVGNPIPQIESLGPIELAHPEMLQSGRPDFSVVHYATDTGIWADYFAPGLEHAFGALWPLVVGGAILGGLLAVIQHQDRLLRWLGGVVLFGLLAYLFTPLSAAGAEGAPEAFRINLRFAIPALLASLTLLPVALYRPWSAPSSSSAGGVGEGWRDDAASSFSPQPGSRTDAPPAGEKPSAGPPPLPRDRTRGQEAAARGGQEPPFRGRQLWTWALLGALLVLLVVTNRADAVVRDPDRVAAWTIALLFVLIPAALLLARQRGAPRWAVGAGFATLAIAVLAIGYPVQRAYLEDRFANDDPQTAIPGMGLDSAYRWARGVEDARIGLAGTTAGFLQYGFYGTDLSNSVRYLGVEGPHGAFHPIPTCRDFRAAVNAAELDYLVTAPFLNFIEPAQPVPSPEAGWLRGEPAATPVDRSGSVTVWRLDGRLDPAACGPANAPLRRIPRQPVS